MPLSHLITLPLTLLQTILNNSESDCLKVLKSKPDARKWTYGALLLALKTSNNENFTELLLKHGALVNYRVIKLAIANNREKSLKMCLKNITEIRILKGRPFFDLFYFNGYTDRNVKNICKLLIKHGCDLNWRYRNFLPLAAAIKHGYLIMIDTLLLYGANPCLRFNLKKNPLTPLEYAFMCPLPLSSQKKLIKYAVLQDMLKTENEVTSFKNFQEGRAWVLEFVKICVAEIKIMRSLLLTSDKMNLFDFLVTQGKELQLCSENSKITNCLFNVLFSTSLPIYKEAILMKLKKRKHILEHFLQISHLKWCAKNEGKIVVLNSECVEYVCCDLSKKDLISLWIAFTSI